LEFFFRLQLPPYHSNRRAILHQTTKFHPTRGDDNIIDFQDGSRGGAILLPVSYLMMSLSSEGQNLLANQISFT